MTLHRRWLQGRASRGGKAHDTSVDHALDEAMAEDLARGDGNLLDARAARE